VSSATKNPVSPKVANGSLAGGSVAIITWILVTAIPAFHHGIPAVYQPLIPALVGLIGYFTAGYKSTHPATVQEIGTALDDAEKVIQLFEAPEPIQLQPARPVSDVEAEQARLRFAALYEKPVAYVSDATIRKYLQDNPARLVSVARSMGSTTTDTESAPTAPSVPDQTEAPGDAQQQ
jgi:hypothetical protein